MKDDEEQRSKLVDICDLLLVFHFLLLLNYGNYCQLYVPFRLLVTSVFVLKAFQHLIKYTYTHTYITTFIHASLISPNFILTGCWWNGLVLGIVCS